MVLLFFRSEHGQFQKCSCPYRISSMPQALIRKISYKRKLEDRGGYMTLILSLFFTVHEHIYIYILGWRYLIFCDFRQCTHCCRYEFNSKKSANLARRATGWAGLGICSIAHSLICSNHSEQISKCERFAQVAQDKWATGSTSLRLLMTNEQIWAIHSGRSGQMSKWANSSVFLCKSLIFSFAHKNDQLALKKFEKIVFLTFFTVFLKVV